MEFEETTDGDFVRLNSDSKYYSVRSSENFGRYLVASQNIPERTTILKEFPIVFAPADDCTNDEDEKIQNTSNIFCLNCCVIVKLNGTTDIEKCNLCGWPLCGSCNQKTETLHQKNECRIFQMNGTEFPPSEGWPLIYKSILILRIVLLIKKKNPSIWEKFFALLEHHNDTRSKKEHCVKADAMIMKNVKHFFRKPVEDYYYNSELIQTIIGVVNVNGFGSTKGKHENLRKTKSIFENGSLFAHSCAPNCTWNIKFDSTNNRNYDPQIEVCTSIAVKKGELLTIAYNTRHLFYGTLKRQIIIEAIAHFECKCARCLDPTELGTMMSSLRCFKCDRGFLISKNAWVQGSDWACDECGVTENVGKVVDFTTDVEEYFDKIQSAQFEWGREVEMLQKLYVKHCNHLFHKNHYSLQEISARILELMVESLKDASLAQIDLFLWHCDYLKAIGDVILPGYNGYQDQLLDYKTEGLFHRQNFTKSEDN